MLTKCYRCMALYRPGNWWRVSYPGGTSNDKRWLSRIDDAHCPICRKEPQHEPAPDAWVAM